MDKNGHMAEHGFLDEELVEAKKKFESKGSETKLINLNESLPTPFKHHENASVLVVNAAATKCFGVDPKLVREELFNLPWDGKKLMTYGTNIYYSYVTCYISYVQLDI